MKKLLVVLVLLGLGLAGVAAWVSRSRQPANGEDLFTLAPVEFGSLAETVGGSGVIQPRDPLPIMPKVAGQIVRLGAHPNNTVEEGQMLCRLDGTKAQRDLESEMGPKDDQAYIETADLGEDAGMPRLVAWKLVALNDIEIDGRYVLAEGPLPHRWEYGMAEGGRGVSVWVETTPEERYEKVLAFVRSKIKAAA